MIGSNTDILRLLRPLTALIRRGSGFLFFCEISQPFFSRNIQKLKDMVENGHNPIFVKGFVALSVTTISPVKLITISLFLSELRKKNCQLATASILTPPTIHLGNLIRFTPNLTRVPQKLTWCLQFGLQHRPIWGDAVLGRFRCFYQIHFPGQAVEFRLKNIIHIWRAYVSPVHVCYLEQILMHPSRRQNYLSTTETMSYPASTSTRYPTRPKLFFATRTQPELFEISQFRVFPSRLFPSRPL